MRLNASEATLLASVLKFAEGCVHQERRRQKRGMMRLPVWWFHDRELARAGLAAGSGECDELRKNEHGRAPDVLGGPGATTNVRRRLIVY